MFRLLDIERDGISATDLLNVNRGPLHATIIDDITVHSEKVQESNRKLQFK